MTDSLYWVFVQQSAWIAGAISIVMTWQMGNKRWWAPFLGLVGQVFWLLLAIFTQQWGLLVTVVLYTVVHGRNALKWTREHRDQQQTSCWCPKCGNELCSSDSFTSDTDLVRYTCSQCGHRSGWHFDAPVPLLIEGRLDRTA